MSETKIVMGSHYEKVLVLSVTTWMEENPLNPTSESADEQKIKPVAALHSKGKNQADNKNQLHMISQ